MSSDLLRRAADKLDQVTRLDTYVRVRADKPHRPDIIEADVIRDITETGETVGIEVIKALEVTVDDVAFGPKIAAPLADWLRAEADAAQRIDDENAYRAFRGSETMVIHGVQLGHALAVARAILGEESS